MQEPFLINPRRRVRRRVSSSLSRRRRKSPLPGRLLSIMIHKYGPKKGMKMAWKKVKSGRRVSLTSRQRQRNPFGEEVMIVGNRRRKRSYRRNQGNTISASTPTISTLRRLEAEWKMKHSPTRRRRKRKTIISRKRKGGVATMARRRRKRTVGVRRRRRRRLTAASFAQYHHRTKSRLHGRKGRRHSVVAYSIAGHPRMWFRSSRSRSKRLGIQINPRRRYRRRRNPAKSLSIGGGISFKRPMSLIMPAAVGVGAYMACEMAPLKLGMIDTFPRLGVKAAVGVGGSIMVGRFLGTANGVVWLIVSSVNILQDVLKSFVFRSVAVEGLGAYPYGAYSNEY